MVWLQCGYEWGEQLNWTRIQWYYYTIHINVCNTVWPLTLLLLLAHSHRPTHTVDRVCEKDGDSGVLLSTSITPSLQHTHSVSLPLLICLSLSSRVTLSSHTAFATRPTVQSMHFNPFSWMSLKLPILFMFLITKKDFNFSVYLCKMYIECLATARAATKS